MIEGWSGTPLGVSETLPSLPAAARMDYFHERLTAAGLLPPGAGREQLDGLVAVFRANGQSRYLPPADGVKVPIALLRAAVVPQAHLTGEQRLRMQDPAWGWGGHAAGPVMAHTVPGDHITMMNEPHVQALAGALAVCLEGASAEA